MFCRWLVGYAPVPKNPAKRARSNLDPVPLQRNGALGEEGFRGEYPEHIALPDPHPAAAPKKNSNKKKKCPRKPTAAVAKTVGKKRPAEPKIPVIPENRPQPMRVRIPFPPMQAPFGGPKKFEKAKNTATLTLSFQGESSSPELQQLRKLLDKVEDVMGGFIKLIRPKEVKNDPITAKQKNTFIREGTPLAEGSIQRWPDIVYLKAYPEMCFKYANGEVVDLTKIRLKDNYDVQPTVELRDIIKVGAVYYPRLVVTECVLYPRNLSTIFMTPADDLEEENDRNIFLSGF